MSAAREHDTAARHAALIRDESLNGRLPLLPGEREYGTWGAHTTCFAYGVATWCFLTGGYAALYLGAVKGMICLLAGNVIGVYLTTMAPGLAGQRYGIEAIDYTKTAFGQRGSRILLVFYLFNQLGWSGIILVMFGNGVRNILRVAGWEPGGWVVGLAVLVGLWLVYLLVTHGVHLLNVSNAYVGPGLLVLSIGMLALLLRDHGWSAIAAAPALDPFDDPWLNYAIVLELSIASGISWWGGVGFLARNTRTRRNAVYPEILQLGLAMGGVCCIALFSSLVVRSEDPTEWMVPIGGVVLGLGALVFVALANISSSAVSVFASGLALRHLRVLRTRPWWHLVLWSLVPCLPFVFWPAELYDLGSNFLAYNGTLYAPVVGILFADFVVVRRQRIDLAAIFDDHPSAAYHYTRGFHWPGLVCLIVGQAIYFSLLDPLSYAASGAFLYLTASLPACLGPAVLYAVWVKLRPPQRAMLSPLAGRDGRVVQSNL